MDLVQAQGLIAATIWYRGLDSSQESLQEDQSVNHSHLSSQFHLFIYPWLTTHLCSEITPFHNLEEEQTAAHEQDPAQGLLLKIKFYWH